MKVSILIVNYELKKEIFECINSIYKLRPKVSFEIIVVDNSKRSIEKDLKQKFPKVLYIKSQRNLGYGGGNNLGAKFAKGEYLFILNPDTKFNSGDLSELINFIEKNKKAGVVAPLLLDEKDLIYPHQGGRLLTPKRGIFALSFIDRIFPNNIISKNYRYIGWDKNEINEVDVLPGTAFVIKKDLFEKIGGFDEKFFLFFEEFDLCYILKKIGFKNYIHPGLKLNHIWGASTSKNPESKKYYFQSRFYYFKKNFGITKAIFTELFLRINANIILLFLIISLALFLRLYRLTDVAPFIGDSAWFFISARDLIIDQKIPLVGITTSHTWLHQGAFWTYILAIILRIFNFNPFAPSYITGVLDVGTLLIIYFLANEMFNRKVAIAGSILYAVSPLVVMTSQATYHTSLIPFITSLFLLSVFRWMTSRILFFPISLFLLAVLYNFEIATISLGITLVIFIFFGILKKKNWVLGLFKPKIIFMSIIAFVAPMTPMLIYDMTHGFPQTLGVIVWIFYKTAVLLGYPPINPSVQAETWSTFFPFLFNQVKLFYISYFEFLSILLFAASFLFAGYKIFLSKFKNTALIIVFVFLLIPLFSYIVAKTSSSAYIPMFFPQAVIILGFLFGSFKKSFAPILVLIIALIVLINSQYLLTTNYFGHPTLKERIEKAKDIINLANGRGYNLIGVGQGSEFESFILNQEYLTWWLGHPPSGRNEELKFLIFPDATIRVEKL